MPAKKSIKSRTSSKKSGFQFRWWMAAGLVAIVALVGILVLRFSNAGGATFTVYVDRDDANTVYYYQYGVYTRGSASVFVDPAGSHALGPIWTLHNQFGDTCGYIYDSGYKTKSLSKNKAYTMSAITCSKG